MSKAKTVAMPADWQQRFKSTNIKVGLQLNLSRAMLEMLCAIADDVLWDRASYGDIHYPDNWVSCEAALTKRGLIERKQDAEREATRKHNIAAQAWDECRSYCKLTPAGRAVVDLLKIVGLFVPADGSFKRRRA